MYRAFIFKAPAVFTNFVPCLKRVLPNTPQPNHFAAPRVANVSPHFSPPGNRKLGKFFAFLDRYGEAEHHVFRSGDLERFLEKSDNRKSHNAVLLSKSRIPDHRFPLSYQLHVDRNSLKICGVNGRDSLDHKFGRTKFHESLVNSPKLLFDYHFGAARDHLFPAVSEHLDFDFEKPRKNIKRIPGGRIDVAPADG